MANAFKHKRYFKEVIKSGGDKSALERDGSAETEHTHSNAETSWDRWSMPAVWNTSSPTKTYELADGNKTVVVTFEFDDQAGQDAFKTAIDTAYGNDTAFPNVDSSGVNKNSTGGMIKHVKTEWLNQDGTTVGATADDIVDIPAA